MVKSTHHEPTKYGSENGLDALNIAIKWGKRWLAVDFGTPYFQTPPNSILLAMYPLGVPMGSPRQNGF